MSQKVCPSPAHLTSFLLLFPGMVPGRKPLPPTGWTGLGGGGRGVGQRLATLTGLSKAAFPVTLPS